MSSRRSSASKRFWDNQLTSRHRAGGDRFYRLKADEHAQLLSAPDRSSGIVDIGCGAGELLFHFATKARVECAIDYSEAMLNRARILLARYDIEFIHDVDVCGRMATMGQPVWTACGSVNQYLDPQSQRTLLDVFAANQRARALYWFDCVDPVRYAVRGLGCDYTSARGPSLRALAGSVVRIGKQVISSRVLGNARWLGSAAMGWGYLPCFWRQECERLSFGVEIVSSTLYEYRYHVIIRKDSHGPEH